MNYLYNNFIFHFNKYQILLKQYAYHLLPMKTIFRTYTLAQVLKEKKKKKA